MQVEHKVLRNIHVDDLLACNACNIEGFLFFGLSLILCHAIIQHGTRLDRSKQTSVMLPLNTESFNSSRSFPVSGVDLVR